MNIVAAKGLGFWRVALLGVALAAASAARAQIPPPPLIKTYNVNTTADLIDDNVADGLCHTSANNCSLRAAVIQANHLATQNTVAEIHVPAGIFLLTRTQGNFEENYDLDLTSPLATEQVISIQGAGAGRTIIDGNQLSHVIYIETDRVVILRNVTIRHGGNTNDGGGIYNNNGSLTVAESVIEDNHVSIGGGIYGSKGGGIYNDNLGTLTLRGSTILGNVAPLGADVYNLGRLFLYDSVIGVLYP